MTFYVKCPFSGEEYSFTTKKEIIKFIAGMMKMRSDCNKVIRVKEGKQYSFRMWKEGNTIFYQTKGVRQKKIVNNDGSLRRV